MIIDVHVHVFPPDVIKGIKKYTDRDPFLHMICSSPVHKYATAEELIKEMDHCGVQYAAASGFASSDSGLCREMNDYVLEAARKYPRRILPMAIVWPLDRGMESEIARAADEGAAGVGELFPWGQKFDLAGREAARLAGLCQERELPLLIHVNESVGHDYTGKGDVSIKEAADFAEMYPQLTIIFAHWGGGLFFYELMRGMKRQLQNVYYDTAASPFLFSKAIYRVAREIGILHKILLGTDYPLIPPGRYLRELSDSGLQNSEIEMVQGQNARRLFFRSQ